jgi:DNA mismatch repair protein MutS
MTMYNDYFEYQKQYQKKFGEKAIVLMENGKFFELFSDETNPILLRKVCDELGIILSRKSKEKRDLPFDKNPHMAGIPTHCSERFFETLQKKGYYIIVIEQTGPATSGGFKREVTQIITPGTILKLRNSDSNYLMNIYITEHIDKYDKTFLYYAVSIIDVTTGKIYLYDDKNVYNFIHSHLPNEILFYNLSKIALNDIINDLNLHNISHKEFKSFDKVILKNNYENDFFKKVYNIKSQLEATDYLGIALYKDSIVSLILLLQYIYELMPSLIQNIDKPIMWSNEDILELRNNTLYQLNIITNNSIDTNSNVSCLLDIICKTSTAMGKREFKNQIIKPIIDVEKLEMIYNFVDILKLDYKTLNNELKNILDIERNHRKLIIGIITPSEFGKLDESYQCILKVFEIIKEKYQEIFERITDINLNEMYDFMKDFYKDYNDTYDVFEMKRYTINDTCINIFKKGIYSDIDKIIIDTQKNIEYFKTLREELIKIASKDKTFDIKFENTKDGYFLTLTEKRSHTLKNLLKKSGVENSKYADLKFVKKNSIVKITSSKLESSSNNLLLLNEKLSNLVKIRFKQSISKYKDEDYVENLKKINFIITKIDLYNCYAKVAITNNYSKPIIENKYNKSYVKCFDLRHPIIEKINTRVDYVPNNIELSGDKEDGILLFGPNATGKSSLMKAKGIAIIMAQCGMFVPCSRMIFYPYKTLFTRIIGGDNIFKGQSSFAVEMIEIKTILDHSNENSLILGDEICRGTEDLSALSLVSSLIEELSHRKCSFIFTTHLHKLPIMENIKKLDNIKSYHLTIEVSNNKIVYLRKIKEGPGNSKYGVEIAKHIVHNDDFILNANRIRNELLNEPSELLSTNTSNYNSNVIFHKCMIPECNKMAVDTHHILHQETADENNFIGHVPKNNESNLIPLCKQHHDDAHNNKIIIRGYVQTTDGVVLDYEILPETSSTNMSKKKYTPEETKLFIDFITNVCNNQVDGNTERKVREEFNNNISKRTLIKMIAGKY